MPVTEAFYEAAVIPELWLKAFDLAAPAWNADGIVISSFPDCLGGLICSENLDSLCTRYVEEDWHKRDIRAARGVPFVRQGKEIVTDLDIFTVEEMEQLPLYAEFLTPMGFSWFAGTVLGESGGALLHLSLQRRSTNEPFSPDDLARLQRDLPHVKRAARLAARSRLSYAEGLIDTLERFASGAVLIDRLGRVIRMNKQAEAYLGTHLQVVSSRLRSPHREANKALQELIAASTRPVLEGDSPAPTSALLPRTNDLPLIVHSYPVVRQACDIFQGARGLLLLSDPSQDRPPAPKILQEIFHLTPAELRVAAGLLRGLDTQQIAQEHQIGAQTVRFHLKSIFAKTGTSHQAQLVSLLARFTEHL